MHPDLIDLGFLHLKTYGACMALGFMACWWLIERMSGRKDLSNLLLLLMVGGVLGSRVAYVIEHWQTEFASDSLKIVRIDQGGLMFYGGLILAVLLFFCWCLFKREKPLALADLLTTALPLGHACGRIGCFFFGCCYGRISNSPFAVSFPPFSPASCEQAREGLIKSAAHASLPVLPTQLFEAAALLLLFVALFFIYRKFRRGTTAVYFMGYAVIRFSLEYLRGDPRAAVGPLSISQTISLGMLILGGIFLWRSRAPRSVKA